MARITVEDCLTKIPNMYDLVLHASRRARQIQKGSDPTVKSKNRLIVTALRELAAGTVTAEELDAGQHDNDTPVNNPPPSPLTVGGNGEIKN
jgi:DNA-directed RNA polymerase subunit omega